RGSRRGRRHRHRAMITRELERTGVRIAQEALRQRVDVRRELLPQFDHTMPYVITRKRGVVQGKIVILIAQLALARKVIVTDPYDVPPTSVAALAALALALGATYWLMRDDPTGSRAGPQHPPASDAPHS